MDLDDSGKERRNALIVSALLFSAAYLELKVPSFIAEYTKYEFAPEVQYKVWLLAAGLALYVAMRYHFSATRAQASELERAAFATAYLQKKSISSESSRCRAAAYQAISELPGMQKAKRDGLHVAANQIEPRRIGLDYKRQKMWVLWRLSDSLRAGDVQSLGKYDPMTSITLDVSRPVRFIMQWSVRQLLWSRKAWEVNPVYLACIAAQYICLSRAAQLSGGWRELLHNVV